MSTKLTTDLKQTVQSIQDTTEQLGTNLKEVGGLVKEAVEKRFRPLDKTTTHMAATAKEMRGMSGSVKRVEIPEQPQEETSACTVVKESVAEIADKTIETANPVTKDIKNLAGKMDEVHRLGS